MSLFLKHLVHRIQTHVWRNRETSCMCPLVGLYLLISGFDLFVFSWGGCISHFCQLTCP